MPISKPGSAGDDAEQSPSSTTTNVTKKKPASKKKLNGQVGVKGSITPPEVQAQIIGALLSGQFATDAEVAKEAKVSKSTVSRIRKSIPPEYLKQIEIVKKDRIGELVVEFLESTLESLKKINEYTSEQEWIQRQDAAGIGVLFGIKADKVTKVLEAIERAHEPEIEEISGTEGS